MVAIGSALSAGIVALVGAGWFVLPAKQTDLTALEKDVRIVQRDVTATQLDIREMRREVTDLVILVKGIDNTVRAVKIPLPEKR